MNCSKGSCDHELLMREVKVLREEKEKLEADKWISVDDGLPKKFGDYLCCGDNLSSTAEILNYFDLEWRWIDNRTLATGVAHWQPIPETIDD